ncbi:MAG: UDP-N-acetylmuramoyl-L-alanyl-D-glutamate--2,6-diaminopimelate ligase [Chloroflexota bacterium]|nr:UDP-N-acetylmuramoyl-L-alanyl-D-glutamate--2,6-diaminopimelate ligase [Chloroflexota bacterium]
MPTLREALANLPAQARVQGRDDVVVAGVGADSRLIRPGDLFVAVRGLTDDGHRYIPDALAHGARAIVSEQPPPPGQETPWVTVPDAREALGWLAAQFHGFPSRRLGVIGVTGTDGKTTTTHLIGAMLEAAGWPVGLISTVQFNLGEERRPNDTPHTTPPAPMIQGLLAEMVARGLRWVVLEVSSHALAQARVAGCAFDIAAFTNLTPEHQNYHGDFERYRGEKARLFAMLGREPKEGVPSFGVFNTDDPSSDVLRAVCPAEQIGYGIDTMTDYRVTGFRSEPDGTTIQLDTPEGALELRSPLDGRFNVYNVAAASAVALRLGVPGEAVARALRGFSRVPGRLQRIDRGEPFQVFVDFAHTPNALSAVLATLRGRTTGRLIVVFGHPGERDPQNRRQIGEVASAQADFLVLTYDDPYDEDPKAVLDQIEGAVLATGRRPERDYLRVDDRPGAIAAALRLAAPGDTVLIAGRGHLEYTVVRGRKSPLSDVELARRELQRLRETATPSG